MRPLSGKISDRLRATLSPSDPAWKPDRPPEDKPMPASGVEGRPISGRNK